MKIVILLALTALSAAYKIPNVAVTDRFGMSAFVDSEEVLERAIFNALQPSGVIKVDVDSLSYDMSTYEVEVYSQEPLPDHFQATLEKVLRSDLGFSDINVKSDRVAARFRQGFYGNKKKFFVYLNPKSMMTSLELLAKNTMYTSNLSIEDSRWD